MTYFNTPRLKTTIFNNGRYTTNIPTDPAQSPQQTQKQTCAVYIHLLSLDIQPQEGITEYCAHLHHLLAALKRYVAASRLPNSEQIITLPQVIFTQSHIHHHYAPSVTLAHTTYIISSTEPTYAPHCHPWICGQTPSKWLHCWPDEWRSWLVGYNRGDRTPPPHQQGSWKWVDNNSRCFNQYFHNLNEIYGFIYKTLCGK